MIEKGFVSIHVSPGVTSRSERRWKPGRDRGERIPDIFPVPRVGKEKGGFSWGGWPPGRGLRPGNIGTRREGRETRRWKKGAQRSLLSL